MACTLGGVATSRSAGARDGETAPSEAGAPTASDPAVTRDDDAGAPPLRTWGAGPDPVIDAGGAEAAPSQAAPPDVDGGPMARAVTPEDDDDEEDDWDDEDDEAPTEPIVWRSDWPRFGLADWIITAVGSTATIASAIIAPQPKRVYGGVLFDESVRSALRLPTTNLRFLARDVSDVLVSLEATWPVFVDAAITTWWYHHSPDAAAQMAAVDLQTIAVITGLQGVTNTIAARERPYARDCGTADYPNQTVECEGNVRYRSFFSGHSAFSFAAAGLICTHHMKLDLFGGGTPEIAACALAYTGAAATASLRVLGDMHYATDILTGAVLGTIVGVGVPLLHYRKVTPSDERPRHLGEVRVVPMGAGVGLGGTF